ncbi:MAG: hypothetical protein WC683_05840 [bacterium]
MELALICIVVVALALALALLNVVSRNADLSNRLAFVEKNAREEFDRRAAAIQNGAINQVSEIHKMLLTKTRQEIDRFAQECQQAKDIHEWRMKKLEFRECRLSEPVPVEVALKTEDEPVPFTGTHQL